MEFDETDFAFDPYMQLCYLIGKATSLETVKISDSFVPMRQSFQPLADALRANQSIKELVLLEPQLVLRADPYNSGDTEAGIKIIARNIAMHNSLKTLTIGVKKTSPESKYSDPSDIFSHLGSMIERNQGLNGTQYL